MKLGIDKYNAECRAIVMRYASQWRLTVERIGRWIDFDNDYKTLNTSFMESVWWVFGELFKKDLVYQGVRVMPYTTGLTTPLSNFEAGLDYRDVNDPAGQCRSLSRSPCINCVSVTVAFQLVDDPKTSLLAWTTTPWTLPSNLGLCVHPDFEYVKIHDQTRDVNFILHKNLLTTVYKDPKKAPIKILDTFKGDHLKGWRYVPLFEYFTKQFGDRAFRVVTDKYVTSDSGTGIVHQAPAFGEDDHRIALAHDIIRFDEMPPCPIDDTGCFTDEVPDFKGLHVKVTFSLILAITPNIYLKAADKGICHQLKANGKLIIHSNFMHSYPFCWRFVAL